MKAAISERTVDCPHGRACGACSLLGRPYGAQLDMKRRRLLESLDDGVRVDRRRILPTLSSPQIEGYRNRAKMVVTSDREGRYRLGYFERRSRNVVDAPECRVLVPELLETTERLRRLLNSGTAFPFALRFVDLRCGTDPTKQHLTLVVKSEDMPRLPIEAVAEACPGVVGVAVNLNPKEGPQVIKGRIEPVHGAREVHVDSSGLSLRVSPGSFFQVNLGLLPEIHARMSEFFGGGRLLIDLYAGVGTHGLALRGNFESVLCIEGVRSAVADAKATIKSGRVRGVEVVASPMRRALRRLRSERPDALVLNPSRAGAEPETLKAIVGSTTERLAYLSCDPATLARDLAVLTGGGFELASVGAVDMMPQTAQVEALAFLRRARRHRAR